MNLPEIITRNSFSCFGSLNVAERSVIMYGEDEIKSEKLTLRNLSSGQEKSISIKELVNEIKKII